jgi:predicted transcriptional regulator
MPPSVDAKVRQFMTETKRSRSSVIAEALTDFLSKQKKDQA